MELYTFTYNTSTGRTQSFRCAAADKAQALRLWAEEHNIVRAVTGGPIQVTSTEVA